MIMAVTLLTMSVFPASCGRQSGRVVLGPSRAQCTFGVRLVVKRDPFEISGLVDADEARERGDQAR